MTPYNKSTATDQLGERGNNIGVFHRHSQTTENRLDAMPQQRHNVRPVGSSPLPPETVTKQKDMMNSRLLNINQVCDALNMGRWKVYELIHTNKLRTIKYGSRRLVSLRALSDCIEQLEGESYG